MYKKIFSNKKALFSITFKVFWFTCIAVWILLNLIIKGIVFVLSCLDDDDEAEEYPKRLGHNYNYHTGEMDAMKYNDGMYDD